MGSRSKQNILTPMHIGIAGHIATEDIADYLDADISILPIGYSGAPLMGVLIGELLKQGYKVSAFTTSADIPPMQSSPIKVSGKNFDVYYIAVRKRAWRPNGRYLGRIVDLFGLERKRLSCVMKAVEPDLIHAHWTYEFALAALNANLPTLITCHDVPTVVAKYTKSLYRWLRVIMSYQVFKRGKYFTAVSQYMSESVQRFTTCPITVVPNPLADYVLHKARMRDKATAKKIAMVCNGWDDRKNPKPAIRGFSRFKEEFPEAELHIYGHGYGPEEQADKWVRKHGLISGIFFHGVKPHKELISEVNLCDILLHPALEESFGVVVVEAMALGLPVVAGKNSGAVPWVLGAKDQLLSASLLCDITDPIQISKFLHKAFDDEYYNRSRVGYERALHYFTPLAVVNAYISKYNEILCS